MNNIIGLKPLQPFTLCEPITVDLRIAATVLRFSHIFHTIGEINTGNARFHALFFCLACLGLNLIPVKKRERVSGKVFNQRFVNSCLANSPSVYIYTVISTL